MVFWNQTGWNAILATALGPKASQLGSRASTMMHVAMADAVFSIHPRYTPLLVWEHGWGHADETAAAASAAHGVLVRLFPAQTATLDAALATTLASIPDGSKKDDGVALGDLVAAQVVALRANDGSAVNATYTPPVGLGYWVPDPRTGASPFLPWASVTPWTMTSNDQFRVGPPPDIFGTQYATDLAELKAYGGTVSAIRTPAQTCLARFATDNVGSQYNRLARAVSAVVPSDLEDNVRFYAELNLAMADDFIGTFDSKYTYNFWRPWSGIRNAAAIGHPELQDSTWLSLIPTPAHPEYAASHANQAGAEFAVFKAFYGEDIPPVAFTCAGAGCGAPACPASYTSGHFDDFKENMGLARIYGGVHYRNSIEVGWNQGDQIGQWVMGHSYVPNDD